MRRCFQSEEIAFGSRETTPSFFRAFTDQRETMFATVVVSVGRLAGIVLAIKKYGRRTFGTRAHSQRLLYRGLVRCLTQLPTRTQVIATTANATGGGEVGRQGLRKAQSPWLALAWRPSRFRNEVQLFRGAAGGLHRRFATNLGLGSMSKSRNGLRRVTA